MIHSGPTLYIIHPGAADKDKANECVEKIRAGDPSVETLSYNGENINYRVDGILVNSKPSGNTTQTKKVFVLVRETPEMYRRFISHIRPGVPRWVHDIFTGKAKGEIVYKETSQYYIMPDFKWDHNPDNLYLLVLFKGKDLQSVRDLRGSHVPMLENAYNDVMSVALEHHAISSESLRCYFHYQPSAWQLHMHIQHINSPVTLSYQSSKAITYTDVIQNLKLSSDYYRNATLECILSSGDHDKFYNRRGT